MTPMGVQGFGVVGGVLDVVALLDGGMSEIGGYFAPAASVLERCQSKKAFSSVSYSFMLMITVVIEFIYSVFHTLLLVCIIVIPSFTSHHTLRTFFQCLRCSERSRATIATSQSSWAPHNSAWYFPSRLDGDVVSRHSHIVNSGLVGASA